MASFCRLVRVVVAMAPVPSEVVALWSADRLRRGDSSGECVIFLCNQDKGRFEAHLLQSAQSVPHSQLTPIDSGPPSWQKVLLCHRHVFEQRSCPCVDKGGVMRASSSHSSYRRRMAGSTHAAFSRVEVWPGPSLCRAPTVQILCPHAVRAYEASFRDICSPLHPTWARPKCLQAAKRNLALQPANCTVPPLSPHVIYTDRTRSH